MTQWGIESLFNPGKRHADEEKRRLQATREEAGDSSGGRRIDLESGTVTIRRTRAASGSTDDVSADPEAATPEVATPEAATPDPATSEAATPDPPAGAEH